MRLAVIAITGNGATLGCRLCSTLPDCELFVSSRYADRGGEEQRLFEPAELAQLVATLWRDYQGLVFIMATGIVVRMVAPLLVSKHSDPAVVVMDDAGRFAISLLSGHLGGGNELAERCSFATGSRAVITTATDANGLPSFDMLAKEQGWVIEDVSRVKLLNRLLLDNGQIAVADPSGRTRAWFQSRGRLSFYDSVDTAVASGAEGVVVVTNRSLPVGSLPDNLLILRPRNLMLGIGCNRGTPADEIEQFVLGQLKRSFLALQSVRCIASAEAKRDEAGLHEFAGRHSLPLMFFSSEELNRMAVPSPPSEHALAAIGAAGVAEPAALLAAGAGHLIVKKVKSPNVTLAVAEAGDDIPGGEG